MGISSCNRWYRAPEVLLCSHEYDYAIDMWSVGCIFAELLGRKPLFPGKDYRHQLEIITRVTGSPGNQDMELVASDKAREYMYSLPRYERVPFSQIYPNANPLACDLLSKMLTFDPRRRITVEQALEHPYLAHLHDRSVCHECVYYVHHKQDEPTHTACFDFEPGLDNLAVADIKKVQFHHHHHHV